MAELAGLTSQCAKPKLEFARKEGLELLLPNLVGFRALTLCHQRAHENA